MADFQAEGNVEVVSDLLNRYVITGNKTGRIGINKWIGIPSSPTALLFTDKKPFRTSKSLTSLNENVGLFSGGSTGSASSSCV